MAKTVDDEVVLTPEQEAFISACEHTETSLLLNSVAGSGKTFVMVQGVHGITANFPFANILALAFNKRIVEELVVRMPATVACKTMNAIGHRAWANKIKPININLNSKKTWAILKHSMGDDFVLPDEARDLPKLVGLAKINGIIPDTDTDDTSTWSMLIEHFDLDIDPDSENWAIKVARQVLRKSITAAMSGEIDFDDQLYMPVFFGGIWPKYDVVLIDEAQDISPLQHMILTAVMKENGRLIAVGDPHQAIYGFRGADHNSMSNLKQVFGLTEMPLTYSFRCPKRVIELAQKIVPHIKAAPDAIEGNVQHLREWYVSDIPKDAAIICRNTAPLIDLAFRMFRRGQSCIVIGRDIGYSMKALITRLKPLDIDDLIDKLEKWRIREVNKYSRLGKEERAEASNDKAKSLMTIIEFTLDKDDDPTLANVKGNIDSLFGDPGDRVNVPTLMTGHKSKGLEYRVVYILDDHLIPSKYAVQPHQIQQEENLRYVMYTRALESLRFVTSKGFEREKEDDDQG